MSSVGCLCGADLGAKIPYDDVARNPMSSPRIHVGHAAGDFFVPGRRNRLRGGVWLRHVVKARDDFANQFAAVVWGQSKNFVGERF